jgi:hypothetical protein
MDLKKVFGGKEKKSHARERKPSNFEQILGDEFGAEGVVDDVRCYDGVCGSELEVGWRDEDG